MILGENDLAARYNSALDRMKTNCVMMFYSGGGKINAVTLIKDTSAPPSPSNYAPGGGYLDDPYEGDSSL
jgi:hypothetical protein